MDAVRSHDLRSPGVNLVVIHVYSHHDICHLYLDHSHHDHLCDDSYHHHHNPFLYHHLDFLYHLRDVLCCPYCLYGLIHPPVPFTKTN